MHKQTCLLMLLFLCVNALAQGDTAWLDAKWKPAQRENASFFRLKAPRSGNGYLFTDYYANGTIQMQGISAHPDTSHWHGKVQWFYPTGVIKQQGHFEHNKRVDTFYSYHPNAALESHMVYKQGVLHGTARQFDSTGYLQFEMDFTNGLLQHYRRFRNNKLILSQAYKKNNVPHGESLLFSEEGVLLARETYVDGSRHGISETFYNSGKMKERQTYENGERNGVSEVYYESGRLKERSYYNSDALHGTSETFSEKGNVVQRASFIDGELNGMLVQAAADFPATYHALYRDGIPDSTCLLVDKRGKHLLQADFKRGILHGALEIDHQKIKVDARFDNGSLVYWNSYHSNGKPFRMGKMNRDSLTEEWITYDAAGRKQMQTSYRFGEAHGTWKKYKDDEPVFQVTHRSSFLDEDLRRRRRSISYDKKKKLEEENKLKDDDSKVDADDISVTTEEIMNTTGETEDVTKLLSSLPRRFFEAEDTVMMGSDLYASEGSGLSTWLYGNGSIRISHDYSAYRSIPEADFRIQPADINRLLEKWKLKEVISPDGLNLLLQSEKAKPSSNELQVFLEYPSEALLKVVRFVVPKTIKQSLRKDPAAVTAICNYLHQKYNGAHSVADIAFALCSEVYK